VILGTAIAFVAPTMEFIQSLLGRSAGRFSLDALLGFLAFLILVPPIVSAGVYLANSLLQFLTSIVAIAVPWLGLIVLIAVGGACLAAIIASLPHPHRQDLPIGLPLPPPVQRPPGLPQRRHDQQGP
jgi:hypothetical protein